MDEAVVPIGLQKGEWYTVYGWEDSGEAGFSLESGDLGWDNLKKDDVDDAYDMTLRHGTKPV